MKFRRRRDLKLENLSSEYGHWIDNGASYQLPVVCMSYTYFLSKCIIDVNYTTPKHQIILARSPYSLTEQFKQLLHPPPSRINENRVTTLVITVFHVVSLCESQFICYYSHPASLFVFLFRVHLPRTTKLLQYDAIITKRFIIARQWKEDVTKMICKTNCVL